MHSAPSAVFYRTPGFAYPTVTRGSGMYLHAADGRSFLDMSGGAAVSALGHAHPGVLQAMRAQLEACEFAHTAFFTSEVQELLSARVVARLGEPGARVYFLSGGSEANETALKMTWQYWAARGQPGRKIIISREHSYHGNTFGALSVSGNAGRRAASAAPLLDWPRISPCYPYRYRAVGESAADYARRAAGELRAAIESVGPEHVAAFICEPVVGSSLGAVPAEPGYLAAIRALCDEYGILLILDEIMCGSGRTGTFFAHQHDGIRADLVTLAKGLAGGYQPLAATIASTRVAEVLAASGFVHGHTYVGHPVACAAGLAVQAALDADDLLSRVRPLGAHFDRLLRRHFGDHPRVGEIRGRGLFHALELVSDRNTKAGFAEADLPERLRRLAMDEGLICYPGGLRTASGIVPHILLAPPYIVQETHFEECISKLDRAMTRAFGQ